MRRSHEDSITLPHSRVLIHLKGATSGTNFSAQTVSRCLCVEISIEVPCEDFKHPSQYERGTGLVHLTWLLKETFSFDFLDVLTFFLFLESGCAA